MQSGYLEASSIIDFTHPDVAALAAQLSLGLTKDTDIAQACFLYVRDQIHHSGDHQDPMTTCSASEVLRHKTGWCYAKSHLLAALLRANRIPTGFCYQRLSVNDDGAPYSLHGLIAIYLKEFGWYRVDPRGNKEGIDAQFLPPHEQLAFEIKDALQEFDMKEVFVQPLGNVVDALQRYKSFDEMVQHFPDIEIITR